MMMLDEIIATPDASNACGARTVSIGTIGSSLWRLADCPQTMDAEQTAAIAMLAARSGGHNLFFEEAFRPQPKAAWVRASAACCCSANR
jgi:hypothetical protein